MAARFRDYYETLGVPKGASQDEVRKAFRKLARQFHPDVAKDKKAAEGKFKEINEAYEVLGDAEKRKKYDSLGADWDRGGGEPFASGGRGTSGGFGGPGGGVSFGGTGFSDFFEQFFSGAAGSQTGMPGAGRARGRAARGSDVEADLLVTLEEALHGAKKKISFRRDGNAGVETYEVGIPQGVREGQRIRLAGRGEAGGTGGQAGDLFLRVRLEKHPEFHVDGPDLIYELELPVWKAVLGTEAEVRTLDGSVRLKIPAGSQPGRKFRLKGRGLPNPTGGRGDFFVQVEVTVPTKLSAEERELWEKIGGLHPD